jgi:predicted nucleic acid-binding protein
MKNNAAFWDTSAVVPLCCVQDSSFTARQKLRAYQPLVVWWATRTESLNSFSRLLREKSLTSNGVVQARNKLEKLQRTWVEIVPLEDIRLLAEQVLTWFVLSTADGFQIAAALSWCKEQPRHRPFICADIQLSKAAEKIGFDVQFIQ